MDLKSYFYSLPPGERERLAVETGTTPGHLRNCMYGYKPVSPALAVAIERFSNRKVTRPELRPGDWKAIWPELDPKQRAAKARLKAA
jgi:DNA-binding transcriptional regulator YdaS (Cro superfamily)